MFSYNINSMDNQTSSYNHKEEEFIINSELLQQPLRSLEEVLYNITFDEVLFNIAKRRVDISDIMGAYIDMLVLAQVWPEERNADRPKFRGRYILSLDLLDPIFLQQLLDPTSRKVVSCKSSGGISQSDITKITCLDLKYDSSYEILYPTENIRNSLLDMLYLIHRRVRGVYKDPKMPIDDKTITIYWLYIRARMYLTQKPGEPRIEISNREPISGFFWYNNGRSKIFVKYEFVIPGYLFVPIPKS